VPPSATTWRRSRTSPAEIRAPAGTIAGVSSFQVQISDHDILTPGDLPTVLVAMNPAALRANINELEPGGTILVNSDAFEQRNLEKAGLPSQPARGRFAVGVPRHPGRDDRDDARVHQGARREAARRRAVEELLRARTAVVALHASGRAHVAVDRGTVQEPRARARREPRRVQGRVQLRRHRRALRAPVLDRARRVSLRARTATSPATWLSRTGSSPPGQLSKLPILYASYPITPASDILHELSKHKNFGVRTLQAEDEIAASASPSVARSRVSSASPARAARAST
jgi:2-oxoglutarate ferredoxin oxidoreductase subunit alpha